jgi:MoxR-like ATPase
MEEREFGARFEAIGSEIAKVIVGHEAVVEEVLLAMLSGGHVLLEGVPGLGKTLLVRTISRTMQIEFSRIQFTPDLMPADIVGTNIVVEDPGGGRRFEFQRGPVFGNVILADEINRATPKTQSALLEAMQEHRVSVARTTHALPEPFFVLATQNPIEMEGTYPLPEAQVDRFLFKTLVETSTVGELLEILDRTTGATEPEAEAVVSGAEVLAMMAAVRGVAVAPHVRDAVCRLVLGTHPDSDEAPDSVRRYVRYGSSPRGAQAITLAAKAHALAEGRGGVALTDVRRVAMPALRHRLILNFEGEAEGVRPESLIADVLEASEGALSS